MRGLLAILLLASLAGGAQGQNTQLPLSRMVEHPYAARQYHVDVDAHTGVRPWLRSDLKDSVPPGARAILPLLDRWSATDQGHRFRGGPLLDANVVGSFGEAEMLKHRVGGGAWLDYVAHPRFSIQANAQVWNESFPDYLDTLVRATRVSLGEGFAFGSGPSYTHHAWSLLASYTPGKYFNITAGRGRNAFGDGYRSLMLSDNANDHPFLRITTTIWRIRYVNLFAALSDIRGSAGDPSRFARKYASMHYLSFNALRRFNISFFEAIVWESNDAGYPRGFDINYLNPVIFYRPTEFQIGSPDNALMGLGLSYNPGRSSRIYLQFVLDEFLIAEVRRGAGWFGNKQSLQIGMVSHDAFQVPGLMLRAEMNYVRPFMYTHSDTRQNYAHFGQPLAHPYGSNFVEALGQGEWRRGRWNLGALVSAAQLGTDSLYSYGNNIFRPESDRPPRDAEGRPENYGYYHGDHSPVTILHNELRAGLMVDPASGLMLEAAWTFRARMPTHGDALVSNFLRLGISCHFRGRSEVQEARYTLP